MVAFTRYRQSSFLNAASAPASSSEARASFASASCADSARLAMIKSAYLVGGRRGGQQVSAASEVQPLGAQKGRASAARHGRLYRTLHHEADILAGTARECALFLNLVPHDLLSPLPLVQCRVHSSHLQTSKATGVGDDAVRPTLSRRGAVCAPCPAVRVPRKTQPAPASTGCASCAWVGRRAHPPSAAPFSLGPCSSGHRPARTGTGRCGAW